MVHGDDYLCSGLPEALKKLKDQLAQSFEIKSHIIGDQPGMEREGKILNRIIRVTDQGWQLEADPRHAELIMKRIGSVSEQGINYARCR